MRKKIETLARNKFIQGSFILTFTNFFVGLLNYFFNSLAAKVLGPKGYGEIATVFSYIVVLSVPIAVFNSDIIRRLGEKGDRKVDAWLRWREWFWTRINKYKAIIIPYFALTFFLAKLSNLSFLASFSILVGLLISFVSVFYSAGFQGLHFFVLFSFFLILTAAIKLAGPIVVFFGIGGINTVIIFLILASVVPFLTMEFIVRKKYGKKSINYSIKNSTYKILFNPLFLYTILSLIGISMISNIDLMFVKKVYSAEIAGIYGGWSLLSKIVFYFVSALTGIIYIFFSDKEQENKHLSILIFTVIAIMGMGIFFYFFYRVFDSNIISILLGKKYLAIKTLLPKAAIFGTLYSIISIINSYFLARKSVFSIFLVVFIPFYVVSLFIFGKNIFNIININLILTLLLIVGYFAIFAIKKNSI